MSIPRRFRRDSAGDEWPINSLDRFVPSIHHPHEDFATDVEQPSDASCADDPLPVWAMKITQSALGEMIDYLASGEPEMAGLLIGPDAEDGLITHFVPDRGGKGTRASFHLDAAAMNRELKRAKECRLDCKGIAHSHPGLIQPSHGDLAYLTKLFALPANAEAAQFFMPITVGRRLYSYVYAHGRVWPTEVFVI